LKISQTLAALASIFLALSLVFSCQFASYAASSVDDWTIFRHDASNTGFSSGAAPTSDVLQLWNYTLDESGITVVAPPVVANGFVYVGSADSTVYCFDCATGTKVWGFAAGGETASSPAVIDDRVYVGSEDGYIYCLDASDGNQLWNYPVGDSADVPVNFADGRLYFESQGGDVDCLDAASGERLWSFSTGARVYGVSPAVYDGYVFATNGNGSVFCLDAASGVRVWDVTLEAAVDSPVVVDGFVYCGSNDGNAYCLDAADGAKIWNYTTWYNSAGPSHGYHWGNKVSSPAVAYGHVYVGSADFDVFCLDATSGDKIWNFSTGAGVYAPPAVAGGYVFAGSYDGNVYCLNASSGAEIWHVTAGVFSPVSAAGSAGSPVIADGVLYVVGNRVLSAWGSPSSGSSSSGSAFPSFEVMLAVVLVVIVAAIGVYVYSKRM
jgi:outer membrane protein assembly factor BamB